MRFAALALTVTMVLACAEPSSVKLEVATPFGEHMVLQRDAVVPVWGTATPGAEVTVAIAGRSATVKANTEGGWRAELEPLDAGGPLELVVTGGGQTVSFGDVLVGDVWVCSGQSNMEWVVADSMNAAAEIAAAVADPGIRHFKVPRSWAETPSDNLSGGEWQATDPDHVGEFTAVGYFFARELRPHADVPVGLINTSWGGSRIEPWMSASSLGFDEAAWAEIERAEAVRTQELLDGIRGRIGELPETDAGLVDGRAVWAEPDFDDGGWFTIGASSVWEAQGWEGMDGVAWYRATIVLTAAEAAAGIRLGLGPIDDSDIAWINGHEVGRTELAWSTPRVYEAPPETLVDGRNLIAVRVEDMGGGGGLYGDAEARFIEVGDQRRPLPDQWRFQIGRVTLSTDYSKNQVPTVLYNKMIHPLLDFPVAGFLWYQGESNAGGNDALRYRDLFATMIREWRAEWGSGDLPFLWVQLANFMEPVDEPGDSSWALLRESQSKALSLPNTAQAVAIDIGEAGDIHPRNKQEVGRRLALAARRVAHGEDVVHSGPVYTNHEIQGRRVVLDFDHVGGGLAALGRTDGRLAEFAIAGDDQYFVRADAVIDGDRVVVRSDEIEQPVAVRYAWADNPENANLVNTEGLPASPFRTDDW